MVNRPQADSHFEEAQYSSNKFSSHNSYVESNERPLEYVYYRPDNEEYFEGPFTERQAQFWYKDGFFYNTLEFRLGGADAPVETLEALKARNGRECPFSDLKKDKADPVEVLQLQLQMLIERQVQVAEEVAELKEEKAATATERGALFNRVSELMDKDRSNEQYRSLLEARLASMEAEVELLKEKNAALVESLREATVEVEDEGTTDGEQEREEGEEDKGSVHTMDVVTGGSAEGGEGEGAAKGVASGEAEQLQCQINVLNKVTSKLGKKVQRLREAVKSVDVIGEGLVAEDGVYDRLATLEQSVEDMQGAMARRGGEGEEMTSSLVNEQIVLPAEEKHGGWFTPVQGLTPDTSLIWRHEPAAPVVLAEATAAAAAPVAAEPEDAASPAATVAVQPAAAAAACKSEEAAAAATPPASPRAPQLAQIAAAEEQVDNWESIDDGEEEGSQMEDEEAGRAAEEGEERAEGASEEERDKENKEGARLMEGGEEKHLELLGTGAGLLLLAHSGSESADDKDVDRLVAAIKGCKMLHIAESIKSYFAKPLKCDPCSTDEKPVELRNAVEYFEHLNRAHFKKCGGIERDLVNQFAYLLEGFRSAVPVPIAISKKQYAEREKNKPWLKREGTGSPTGKISKKKK